jgi:ankyrin repeat protein
MIKYKIHGNTPLHLAAMLGHIEIACLLTKYGAVVKARNKQMWTPLDEAISYGNRDLSKIMH